MNVLPSQMSNADVSIGNIKNCLACSVLSSDMSCKAIDYHYEHTGQYILKNNIKIMKNPIQISLANQLSLFPVFNTQPKKMTHWILMVEKGRCLKMENIILSLFWNCLIRIACSHMDHLIEFLKIDLWTWAKQIKSCWALSSISH